MSYRIQAEISQRVRPEPGRGDSYLPPEAVQHGMHRLRILACVSIAMLSNAQSDSNKFPPPPKMALLGSGQYSWPLHYFYALEPSLELSL